MSSELKVDTISEKTTASGVTIDGVKLKDSIVEVDTINESTSGSGVTIDGVLIKDGEVDGIDVSGITSNPAFEVYDGFGLTNDASSTGDITSWTDFGESNGVTNIGSSMTHSSGIFTFPSTGIYEVRVRTYCDLPNSRNFEMNTQVTTNNSTYNTVARSKGAWNENNEGSIECYNSVLIDVTDTSNVKVKFNLSGSFGSYTRVRGSSSTRARTYCEFIKVAST